MRSRTLRLVFALAIALTPLLAVPAAAQTDDVSEAVSTFDWTPNMHPMGFSERAVPFSGPGSGVLNSDLAFWGRTAYQGTYEGFRIIDIREPDNPVEVLNYAECSPGSTAGNQGDVLVWEDLLIRSWNSPASATASCDGELVGAGFEGLHIFDISDTTDPDLVGSVRMAAVLPNVVTVDPPSTAAGEYVAAGASFGPEPTEDGLAGDIVLADDGEGTTTDGCEPLVDFPAGAIALIDRGQCNFVVKVANAQDAGAVAVIVANQMPGDPFNMGGSDPSITIPSVMISLDDGNTIKAGLPATGSVARDPDAPTVGCGSHTATLVPDVANGRLFVYNSASSGACPGIDIVEIPLDDPGSAEFLHRVPAGRSCHDTGVILGGAMLAGCAGGNGFSVFSMAAEHGGSLEEPALLYSRQVPGVGIGHSAAFSWDGDTLIFGHEPGGGGQPQCQESSPEVNKTMFFFEARTGEELGRWVLPRPQTNTENCTIHNYNVVPTPLRDVVVSGNYQSGVSVVDFTDPANPTEVAFADPAPLSEDSLITGGDWSTYWYDGFIYESDIRRGLIVWNLSDKVRAGAMRLGHLNPQTQQFTIP